MGVPFHAALSWETVEQLLNVVAVTTHTSGVYSQMISLNFTQYKILRQKQTIIVAKTETLAKSSA